MHSGDLFADQSFAQAIPLAAGILLLPGLALPVADNFGAELAAIIEQAALRKVITPGGFCMSVMMSNCGPLGWVSDRAGYRYQPTDPSSGQPWPAMPASWLALAQQAATRAGFADFSPDACLINRYLPGARMSLHQDQDERDFSQPIVSLSFGLPAVFQLGGLQRADPVQRIALQHGDALVWGGPAAVLNSNADS